MQLDFHYSITFILARLAGFSLEDAQIIAYCSQYVDDSVRSKAINFKTGEIFKPIASAHKMIDPKNLNSVENRSTWVSFHFLPGNCNLPHTEPNQSDFFSKLICRPNSFLAKDMLAECIRQKNQKNALYRLGITLHVYADTWAHQGFVGVKSPLNKVKYMDDYTNANSLAAKVGELFGDLFDRHLSGLIDTVWPLGHAAALTFPDKPFLWWKYVDSTGNVVKRDNTNIFMDAIKNIYLFLKKYIAGSMDAPVSDLDLHLQELFFNKMFEFKEEDALIRNDRWMKEITGGTFGIEPQVKSYIGKGPGSWEAIALGEDCCEDKDVFEYTEAFMSSHWKSFQDALVDHHYFLTRRLFPKYHLCIR